MSETKTYTLLGPDGPYASTAAGKFGGNSESKIYGRLDCKTAKNALGKGYEAIRVFFADEATAIATGYRPCHSCMYQKWKLWEAGNPRWKESDPA
jgi:methylphosphotriester-DNA--protein-cysteine methyltransferase